MVEPSGSPRGPAHARHTTQAAKDTPRQRSNRHLRDIICNEALPFRPYCRVLMHSAFVVPGDLYLSLWPWHSNSSERTTKHVFHVNLAQIRSVVPAIHCQIRVLRIERVSPISCIWCINGPQIITVVSGVSGLKFTKFLYDVGLLRC